MYINVKVITKSMIRILYCYCREDEEEDESGACKNTTITSFFKQVSSNKRHKAKHDFFTVRNLAALESL
jgi:hypothetical protein